MVALSVFMDAAGKPEHGPEEWCVVAGMLADVQQWEDFESAWNACLSDYHIPYLQMSALHARKRPFDDGRWNDSSYMESFLSRAGSIVREHVQMWGVDAIKNADFMEASERNKGLAAYTNAYGLCGTAVALRLQMQRVLDAFPDRLPIEHFFEEGNVGMAAIRRVFASLKMNEPIVRPGKPCVKDPSRRYYVQFQAADWLAFESRRIAIRHFPNRPPIRPSMKALLKGIPGEAKVWTLPDLMQFCDKKISRGEMS